VVAAQEVVAPDRKNERIAEEVPGRAVYYLFDWRKGDEETCAFDLLVEATSEIPNWLEVRRKSMMHRHPAVSLLIFMLLLFGVSGILQYGTYQDTSIYGGLISTLSVVFLVSGVYLYLKTKKEDEIEYEETIKVWRSKFEKTCSEMERMIEGL
jgi:energy-converting hydrogenase Eha subunit C